MYGLLEQLYGLTKQKQFESLYSDSDSETQMLLRAQVAEHLKDCPRLLPSHGTDWILCTLANANKPEEDTVRVFNAVIRKFNKIEFGLLTDKIQWREMNDVADCCLVGIGFFRKRMERQHIQHAAPSVDYYMEAGSVAFKRLGFDRLGTEFEDWTNFIEREFVMES
jgi:hypothetical protein